MKQGSKCGHLNVTLSVMHAMSTEIQFENGEVAVFGDSEPWPTGQIEATCPDCELSVIYKNAHRPKWLIARMSEVERYTRTNHDYTGLSARSEEA